MQTIGVWESGSLLDLSQTIAEPLLSRYTYPWEVLRHIQSFIQELGPTLPADEYEQRGDGIWIARSAVIAPSASLTGPLIIGADAEIRHNAFFRGSVIIGAGSVVGNSSEMKNAILFNRAQTPHFNYVGDSVLGFRAHMGAGAITSNVKSDSSLVILRDEDHCVETGLRKFGAVLGDRAEIGCNSVLNPGSVIGRDSVVYPLTMVRGYVPPDSIVKGTRVIVPRLPRSNVSD